MGKLSSFEMRELVFKAFKSAYDVEGTEDVRYTAEDLVNWGLHNGVISRGEVSETDLASELIADVRFDPNSFFVAFDDSEDKIRKFSLKPFAYDKQLYDDVPEDKLEEFSHRIDRFFKQFASRKIADIPMMENLISALGFDIYNEMQVEKTEDNNFIIYPNKHTPPQVFITSFNDKSAWDSDGEYKRRMGGELKNRCIPMALVVFTTGIRFYYFDVIHNTLDKVGEENFESGCLNYETFWFASAFCNNSHKFGESGRVKLKVWRSLNRIVTNMPDAFLNDIMKYVPNISNADTETIADAVKQYFCNLIGGNKNA